MRKCLPVFVKRSFFLMIVLLGSLARLEAQTDIQIGTGNAGNTTTTYPTPIADYFEGMRAQYLYKASELLAAGMTPGNITALKFNVLTVNTDVDPGTPELENFTIRIGTTTTASLTNTSWENVTNTVYTNASYINTTTGWNGFNFSTPFFWNGIDNIVVEVCHGDPGNVSTTNWTSNTIVAWTTGLSFNGSHTRAADGLGNLCGTTTTTNTGTQTTRPNIIFTYTPAAACSGTPTGGTATTSTAVVCGNSFTLTPTGTSLATGLSYQWQSSPNNTDPWTDITGGDSYTFTTTQSVTTYYRLKVTCANGGGIGYSTSVLVTSPAAVCGTFTINNALPTGGGNFNSFNDAYNYIKCGISCAVVFNVVPGSGPYNERLEMTAVPGASSVNTITFNGNGATIQSNGTTTSRAVIRLDDADHITFNNLVINATGTGTSDYGYGVQLLNNADSNTVANCTININTTSTSTNFAGIVMNASAAGAISTGATNCDYNTFRNNTITGGYYGITMVASSTESVMHNRILNNRIQDFYLYGTYLLGNFTTLIDSNVYSRPTRTSVSTFYGVYMTGLSTRVTISRNTFTNPFGGAPASTSSSYAVYLTGVDALAGLDNIIANNLVYNITGTGDAYGFYNSSSDDALYYHNTIVLDGTGGASNLTRGFYQTGSAAGIDFRNNIIAISRGGNGTKTAIYLNTPASSVISNRNDFYITSTTGTNLVGNYGGTAAATLTAWQTLSSQDANSLASNPVFTDPINGNFKPMSSNVNDLGTPVGITDDILGVQRSTVTPDMGAFEFTPPPCLAPPTPGVAAVSATPVCVNNPVQLTLSGNTSGLTQTYTWQTSATGDPASFVAVGNALTNPDTTILASTTLYYRVAVTCGVSTTFSTAVLVTVNPALAAGTYTINSSAPTGGTNFTSFADAKAAMTCGISGPVVFNVLPGANAGIYNEQLVLNPIAGTSSVNTVTFNGGGNTIQFLSSATDERATIKLNGADFVTFNNLVIRALGSSTTEYGFGVQLLNNADSNTFNGCQIFVNALSTSTNFAGIVVSNSATSATTTGATLSDGNKFNNNTVTGGYYGITLVGSTADPIKNNEVTNNTFLNYYIYGAYLSGNKAALIQGNDFSSPGRTVVTTTYSIYATGVQTSLRIDRNRIHDIFKGAPTSTLDTYGIYFTGVDANPGEENIVSNNAIYNIYGNSDQYGIYNSSSDYAWYLHNTIALNDQTANYPSGDWTRGFYQITAADGLVFKNNLVSVTRTGLGTRHAVYLGTAATTIEHNYNNYHVEGPAASSFIGYSGANQPTLAAWQTTTAQDANSLAIDPLFTSPATGDLSPRHPVLDNKGTPIASITTDINNQPRSTTTPDIGAFEFSIPPCTTPPVAGTAVAVPNVGICMGAPIALSVTGATSGSGQTYQWEYSVTGAANTWLPLGTPMMFADTTIEASVTQYYRVAVTCSGNTSYSVPALVTLNPALLGGVYTINPALPAALPNFQSFNAAVAAMECGITSSVTFLVAPGTYTEQVRVRPIAGTSPSVRVTFQAANGIPSSVTLTNNATAAANYTLQLDSAAYVTFKTMTITASNMTNGRVIDLAGTSSNDSLHNLVINAPVVTTGTGTGVVGIYSGNFTGANNVIDSNSINNGVSGIYLTGGSANTPRNTKVSNNIINGAYYYGIYLGTQWNTQVIANTINRAAPMNATNYALYMTNVDSNYQVQRNRINLNDVTGTGYGMYMTGCDAKADDTARVTSNTIMAVTNNSGTVYGMYQTASTNNYSMNNVIVVNTTGTTSAGLYSTGGSGVHYYNNSVNNLSPNGTSNNAAYFSHSGGTFGAVDIRNNVFAHNGSGRAMEVANGNNIYSDYNLLYSAGPVLVRDAAVNRATLQEWRDNAYWDLNSIVYKPAFLSNTDLRPDVNVADVWAMHGRGVQIPASWSDFQGAARPTTLMTGVPDLGAYEFFPAVAPPALTPTPATAAPGVTQTFMFGTDTVSKVTWNANSTVPSTIRLRRYSGVLPTGLAASDRSMYYYNQMETTGGGTSNFSMQNFYVESWLGFIPAEGYVRLGRTDNAGTWIMEERSKLDSLMNWYQRDSLNYMDRFTGLMGSTLYNGGGGIYQVQVDSSNRGKRFWVAYQRSYDFFSGSNNQNMVVYLSTDAQPAVVTVKVKGTNWARTYTIPAFTAISSDRIPKGGMIDARLLAEGFYGRGISIESDVPITAYAHIYSGSNSGATMLLPVGTYGYEYYTLTSRQYYSSDNNSAFFVIADRDNTKVEITPTNPTTTGRQANVPFTVTLNAGDVYQVLGASIDGSNGYDMTGSKVRSVPNADGKCYPIAVFAGSTRTAISCGTSTGSNGDVIMQQIFPYQAWGKNFLTAPTSTATAPGSTLMTNIYRILVKDPATQVLVDGSPIAVPLQNGRFYQIESGDPLFISTDRPVLVAQFMASSGSTCANNSGHGDPEMFYLSPVEQAVKYAAFYRNTLSAIQQNYLTIVLPTAGLASLTIDGSSTFSHTYPHSRPGYTVVVQRWGNTAGQSIVRSDSAFTGIVYGTGSVESYGYNVGTLVKNLNGVPAITNTLASIPGNSPYTCTRAPFRFTIQVPLQPTSITWQFSAVPGMQASGTVPGLQPNGDVIDNNPVPSSTVVVGGQTYYQYTVALDFVVSTPGNYLVPIRYTHPEIEGCNSTAETTYPLMVKEAPQVDFNNNQPVCAGSTVTLTGSVLASSSPANTWSWDLGTNPPTGGSTQAVTATYNTPGTYNVRLRVTSTDGCVGDTTKQVTVAPIPTLAITADTVQVCNPAQAIFTIQNPDAALTYNWYAVPNAGTPVATGSTFTAPAGTGGVYYYVEANNGTCTSERKTVKAVFNESPALTLVNANLTVCSGTPAVFEIQNPTAGATYSWFDVATGGTALATGISFTPTATTGTTTYYVEGSNNGCTAARIPVTVTVNAAPTVALVNANLTVCSGTAAVFEIQNPATGVAYNWFDAATGGAVVATGTSFTAPNIPGATTYYVEGSLNGCTSSPRVPVTATVTVPPAVTLVNAALSVCSGTPAVLTVQNPTTGATYSWYNAATGGTAVATGTNFTVPNTPGTAVYYVEGTNNGCTGARVPATVTITASPVANVVEDTIGVCSGTAAIFEIQNPVAGATYSWYNTATGGTAISSGTSFTAPPVAGTATYYVEASFNGCTSNPRTLIVARLTVPLPSPVVTLDSAGVNFLRFRWNAVPGATAYEVSVNNSGVWTAPSSGATGLLHTVTGLSALQQATLNVRALGATACETSAVNSLTERTLGDDIFIPNSFTPNGDGLNDVLRVYGGGIRELRFYVFNQWGEKVFESTDPTRAWDGTYKGKAQPSGVYMYVSRIVLANGNVLERKGSINLIR